MSLPLGQENCPRSHALLDQKRIMISQGTRIYLWYLHYNVIRQSECRTRRRIGGKIDKWVILGSLIKQLQSLRSLETQMVTCGSMRDEDSFNVNLNWWGQKSWWLKVQSEGWEDRCPSSQISDWHRVLSLLANFLFYPDLQ